MKLSVFNSFFYYHCFDFVTNDSVQDFMLFHDKGPFKTEIAYHQHDLFEIFCSISGNIKYYINGISYNMSPGDIFAVKPGELHRQIIEEDSGSEMIILLVNKAYIDKLSVKNPNISNLFEIISENNYLNIQPDSSKSESIKSSLAKIERAQTGKKEKLKKDYFIEFIYLINNLTASEIPGNMSKPNSKISNIIQYIDENLYKDLSLNIIADTFYISKYHLLREFTKYANCTLYQYILHKRLEAAKKLIDNGQTLDQIYRKCGFDSYSTFYNAFKKRYGISPKKYSSLNN